MGRLQEAAKQKPQDIYAENKYGRWESYSIFEYLRKTGKLPSPECCQECGKPQKGGKGGMHRHHPDYHYPGRVEFLCPKCHGSRRGGSRGNGGYRIGATLPRGVMVIRKILEIPNHDISFRPDKVLQLDRIKDLESQNA